MNNDQNNLLNGMNGVGTFTNSTNLGPVPNPNDNLLNQNMPMNNSNMASNISSVNPNGEVPSMNNMNVVPTMDMNATPVTSAISPEVPNPMVPPVVNNMPINGNPVTNEVPFEPINLQPMGRIEPVVEAPKPVEPTPLNGMNLSQMQEQASSNNNMNVPNMGVPSMGVPNMGVSNMGVAPMQNNNNIGGINNTLNPMQPNGIDPSLGFMGSVPVPPTINMPVGAAPVKPPKEKKKLDKKVIIVIVVLLILGIGGGVFFFLNQSANKVVVTTSNGYVELGDVSFIPTNITSYVTNKIINVTGKEYRTKCTVSSPSLDVNKVGSYQYSVTCQGKTTQGQLVVKDSKAPTVVVKTVYALPGSKVEAKDFVIEAKDLSGDPSISLENDIDTSKLGSQDIVLIASDSYDNSTQVDAKLIVDNNAPVSHLRADITSKVLTDASEMPELEKASVMKSYIFGISSSNTLYSEDITLETIYNFSDDKDNYELAKQDIIYSDNGLEDTFDTLEGHVSYNDQDKTIKVLSFVTSNDVTKALNTRELPINSSSLQALLSEAGYTTSVTGGETSYVDDFGVTDDDDNGGFVVTPGDDFDIIE